MEKTKTARWYRWDNLTILTDGQLECRILKIFKFYVSLVEKFLNKHDKAIVSRMPKYDSGVKRDL